MKHSVALSLGALALTITTLGIASSASAHGWQNGQGQKDYIKPAFAKHRVAANQALEAGDYSAWVESMGDHPYAQQLTDIITEDTFSTFVQAHQLMQSGNREAAQALFAELGLPERPQPMRHGRAGMKMQNMREGMDEVRKALEDGDYAAFEKAVLTNHPFAHLTEDQFTILTEAHQLRQSGDHDAAKTLMESLNLPNPPLRGQH